MKVFGDWFAPSEQPYPVAGASGSGSAGGGTALTATPSGPSNLGGWFNRFFAPKEVDYPLPVKSTAQTPAPASQPCSSGSGASGSTNTPPSPAGSGNSVSG